MTSRTVVATVTDSLGRTASTTQQLTVNPVTAPRIAWGIAVDLAVSSIAAALAVRPNGPLRLYNPGAPTGAGVEKAAPAGIVVAASAKYDLNLLASGDPAAVAACTSWIAAAPDTPGQRRIVQHEPTNPAKHITGAEYDAGEAAFAALVAKVNKTRTNPVIANSTNMAYLLDPGQPQGPPDAYYAPLTELGFDCYTPAQIREAAAYAASKGKPWSMLEVGYAPAGSSAAVPTDSALLVWTKAMVAETQALPNPPALVCWMSHLFQPIGGGHNPLTTAFYASL